MTDPFNPQSFPLHDAARDGKNLLVRELSKSDPTAVLAKDADGRTPLFWAASAGNTEGLSELLKAVAETPALARRFDVDDTDGGGWTLLHVVSSTGDAAAVALLAPLGPDADAQTAAGQTPLHFAVSKRHLDVVRQLLAPPLSASARVRDARGQAPLHRAAALGLLPVARLLVEEAGAPLNTADNSGWTPLHHALAEGHGDVAVYLAKAGADITRQDPDGKTPLDVAVDAKTRSFVEAALAE